ncbi:oligosaccharide repeat unit polymerase [Algoriphagus marincola]|uniref:Oligosaccharide repeat unit polymerase n=1 Tax=Algoriphagus marincola TaxID=264027 RepID=A0ABS7N1R0_9BACT|nr:O-antigen polymerase [Algoriphagus marincola]MBY5949926.1 oligosaccharide repeat unit polymerase [Algoriphagus marincola]
MMYFAILYFLFINKKSKVVLLLFSMILFTLIIGYVIDKVPLVTDIIDFLIMCYTSLILGLLIHGFNKYQDFNEVLSYKKDYRFKLFIRLFIIIGLFTFAVNLYIGFKAFGALFAESINVQEYKNEGEASDFLVKWVGRIPLFLSRFFSPIGFLAIGFHFYFLIKRKIVLSVLSLIISFNIPLLGFHGLSRAAATQYLLIYFSYFFYSYNSLTKGVKKIMFIFGFSIIVIAAFLLNTITESRFSKYYYIPPKSQIQDPVLYSTLDYLSQWNFNSSQVLKNYSIDKLMFGRANVPIISFVGERLGFDYESLSELRYQSLGVKFDGTFNGVVATIVYDFGFFFTFIIAFLFYIVVKRCAPKNGKIHIHKFLAFGLIIPLPLMFFTNSAYSYISINLAIIYLFIIGFLMKIKKI